MLMIAMSMSVFPGNVAASSLRRNIFQTISSIGNTLNGIVGSSSSSGSSSVNGNGPAHHTFRRLSGISDRRSRSNSDILSNNDSDNDSDNDSNHNVNSNINGDSDNDSNHGVNSNINGDMDNDSVDSSSGPAADRFLGQLRGIQPDIDSDYDSDSVNDSVNDGGSDDQLDDGQVGADTDPESGHMFSQYSSGSVAANFGNYMADDRLEAFIASTLNSDQDAYPFGNRNTQPRTLEDSDDNTDRESWDTAVDESAFEFLKNVDVDIPECCPKCVCGADMTLQKNVYNAQLHNRLRDDNIICDECNQKVDCSLGQGRYIHSIECNYDICTHCATNKKKEPADCRRIRELRAKLDIKKNKLTGLTSRQKADLTRNVERAEKELKKLQAKQTRVVRTINTWGKNRHRRLIKSKISRKKKAFAAMAPTSPAYSKLEQEIKDLERKHPVIEGCYYCLKGPLALNNGWARCPCGRCNVYCCKSCWLKRSYQKRRGRYHPEMKTCPLSNDRYFHVDDVFADGNTVLPLDKALDTEELRHDQRQNNLRLHYGDEALQMIKDADGNVQTAKMHWEARYGEYDQGFFIQAWQNGLNRWNNERMNAMRARAMKAQERNSRK